MNIIRVFRMIFILSFICALMGSPMEAQAQDIVGTISGSVKDTNGNPIEGVGVLVSSDSYFDGTCSDGDGNYSFNDLPEDNYNLSASINSFYCSPATEEANYAQEFWRESSFPNGAKVVTLNAGNPIENNINFTLSPGGSISGKIYDTDHNPITGVSIGIALNLEDYSSPTEIYTCTNPDTGEYELKHIPLNITYKVAANVFPCGLENPFAMVYAWPDSPANSGGAKLTPTIFSPDLGDINFTLTPGGSISGKIYDTDGNTITGMSIGIALNFEDYSSPTEIYTCTNSDTGEYELKHIPLNVTYKVAANVFPCGPENPFAPVNAWPDSPINSGGATFTLTESNPSRSSIDFYLHQLGDTPAGNDVLTFTPNGFITYQSVIVSGTTTVEPILSDPPQAPSNFEVLGDFYEVSTTAAFTSAQVCFNYADTGDESTIRLLHNENSVWVDVTDNGYPDTQDNVICGTVSSFSPFVVARKLPFSFNGFFQPIDNLPTLNLVKAGSAIPVRFSLGGDQGLNIFYTDYPKSQQIGCNSSAPVDGIEETVSAGLSGLSYSPTTDTYVYVWKTDKAWAGTCRTLVVKLIDGTYYRANFKFK